MTDPRSASSARPLLEGRSLAAISDHDLLVALMNGCCLSVVVPIAIDIVEQGPLASVGHFPGDLLRGLMEVPGMFWGKHHRLYDRYRDALRSAAALRRQLGAAERMRFWEPLTHLIQRKEASPEPIDGN
jgi:hypothetical protein